MPKYPGVAGATVSVPSNLGPIALQLGGAPCYLFGTLKTGSTQLPITDGTVTGESLSALVPIASIPVMLQARDSEGPPAVMVEFIFSGAPGGFSLQIQEADTDADAFYITSATATYTVTAVNATTQAARVDLSPSGGKFIRVLVASLTNNVSLICKITRMA